MSRGRMALHRHIYTSHQVLNKLANDIFADIVEFTLWVSCVMLIIWIYMFFRFSSKSYAVIIPLIACCIIVTWVSLHSALTLAVSCSTNSREYFTHRKCPGKRRVKYDTLFWKSRKSTTIRFGHYFSLETKNFVLQVFGEIILQNVLSLLVTY